jgi:hypothetical protein
MVGLEKLLTTQVVCLIQFFNILLNKIMSVTDGDNIAPTFYRDFATTQSFDTGIGPALTFSRGSNATYTDIDGNIQYASNNQLLNSEAVGVGAGTPGTVPTNWNALTSGLSGLTRTIATGTINGLRYVDFYWSGTLSSGGLVTIYQDPQIPAFAPLAFLGQTWTASLMVSFSAAAGTAIPPCTLFLRERDINGVALNASTATYSSSTLTKYSITRTLNQPTVRRVSLDIRQDLSNGSTYNYVTRIMSPQLELGASPTDYKPTTGTAYYGPRFDFDSVTDQCKGLLIEETRTNVLSGSTDLTTSYWLNYNTPVKTVGTGIAGQKSLIVTDNDVVNYTGILQTFAPQLTGDYTFSCLIKKDPNQGTASVLRFGAFAGSLASLQGVFYTLSSNTFNGTFNLINNATPSTTDAGIRSYGTIDYGSYYKLYFTAYNNLSAFNRFEILPGHGSPASGSNTGSLEIAAPQIEFGSFVTSYIPTMSAQETRLKDVVNVLAPNISTIANQNQGTLTCVSTPNSTSSIFHASIGVDGQNFYAIRQTGVGYSANIRKSTITSGDIGSSPTVVPVPYTKVKAALTYSLSAYSFSVNGGFNSNTRNDLFLPSFPVYLCLGGIDSSNAVGGSMWISSVAYYPYAMSPFQLKALTR